MGTKENSGSNVAKVPTASAVVKPYGKILLTLQNCLLPDDKLNSTPSSIDGLDTETETDLRILGCELIQTAGILLRLPQVAMATGQVIFQRFYYSKSLVRHNMETTAMACVCLASKIEEAPRHIRDVINVFNHIKQVNGQKEQQSIIPQSKQQAELALRNKRQGLDQNATTVNGLPRHTQKLQATSISPVILDQNYVALKNQVIKSERRVLKELGFCVHVKHPHKIIVMYLQVLGYEKNKALMQQCWNYMNDSLRSDVFIRYEPETVACACVYLGARHLQLPLPNSPSWFSIFKVSEESIRDICRRILRLYTRPRVKAEALEKRVEELKKRYEEARNKARAPEGDGHTPSPPSTNKSAHNAWGGFISRSGTHAPPERTKSPKRSKSTSVSPTRVDPLKHSKRKKRSRTRSRSPSRSRKLKKSSHYSTSHKVSRSRHRSRSRSREREADKSGKHRSKHRRH